MVAVDILAGEGGAVSEEASVGRVTPAISAEGRGTGLLTARDEVTQQGIQTHHISCS